jgi:hypothetical protein
MGRRRRGIYAGWWKALLPDKTKVPGNGPFRLAALADLRPAWPVLVAAGICGYDPFLRDSQAGCEPDPLSRRSDTPNWSTKISICREFTGATGLEPATSGVTGRFGEPDD